MQIQKLSLNISIKKLSTTFLLIAFCLLIPLSHNQKVLAQTPEKNIPNSPKQEKPIEKQNLQPNNPQPQKIEENQTQQPEKPEVKKETIDIGVSIGYNTFVVTALALLITILSIVLTIFIFVLGFLGYSEIKKIRGLSNELQKEKDEISKQIEKIQRETNTKSETIKSQLEDLEKQINGQLNQVSDLQKTVSSEINKTENLTKMIDNISDDLNGQLNQVSDLQKTVSSEIDKTENLTKMIDNISDNFKKYIQTEAIKMNMLTMVDHYRKMKNFEQSLKEIEDFEKKYLDEKELLKKCKLNRASILCNQEYGLNNYDLALKNLEELLDWGEDQIEIYNLIAYCYSQKYYDSDCQETNLIKQAKEQLKQLEKIIAEDNQRENFKLKINLGNYEIHLGDFKAALQYFHEADSCLDGINSQNSPGEFYLWRVGKLICYLSCIQQYKSELEQEFQIFTSNIDEWNEGLKYCKIHFQHLGKYLTKLEEEFDKFKQGETT
jgi:tetratricopeptide (TPR) repeat protein